MPKAAPQPPHSLRFSDLETQARPLDWSFHRTTLDSELPAESIAPRSAPLRGRVIEAGIGNRGDLESKPAASLCSFARIEALWAPETEAVFTRARSLWKKKPDAADAALTHTVTWPAGHRLALLGLPEATDAFALHEALREHLAPQLKPWLGTDASAAEAVQLRFHLLALSSEQQKLVLEALAYLLITLPWTAHRFTKTAKGDAASQADRKKQPSRLSVSVATSLDAAVARSCVERGTALGRANNRVRTLAELPANILNPRHYRALAEQLARSHGLKTEFLDTRALTRLGAGAFLAVARADLNRGAGILKVKYAPPRASKHIALVGKGICFDTGGYNLKTNFMHGMHGDMAGSAVALALVCAIAELKLPVAVTAHLALAENLISPTAYKPNEVVTACDGTTIEVVDTDAEGRMLLSDTLALVRREKPDLCLDFATLTGAAIRALDRRIGAVFAHSSESPLLEAALAAGRRSGERVWPFPCGGDYRKGLKSEIADLLQCSSSNYADHIYAATFLSHFIGEETPWVHLDLTPATSKGGLGMIESSATGFGVRWAAELVGMSFDHTSSVARPEKRRKAGRTRR